MRRRQSGDAAADDDDATAHERRLSSFPSPRWRDEGPNRFEICNLLTGLDGSGNHVGDHLYKGCVIIWTTGAVELDAGLCGGFLRFDIKVVKNFDMVANKADGSDDDIDSAPNREIAYDQVDVGFEPGITRFPTAALIGDGPVLVADLFSDGMRSDLKLLNVRRLVSHRDRHAVRGENQRSRRMLLAPNPGKAFSDELAPGLDKQRMIVPSHAIVDLRRISANFQPRIGNVPLIPPPARI